MGFLHIYTFDNNNNNTNNNNNNNSGDATSLRRQIALEFCAADPDREKVRMTRTRPVTLADMLEMETICLWARNEAATTLESLLHCMHEGPPGEAISITGGIAFSWRQLLRNTITR